ncbi:hypothetical protein [Neorhizobium petrolearium]|uniref:hypothetical protein n=1 Tax=Neorhizobium petrolearium TaxID=515361 RepID=UPI003F18D005
MGLILMICCMYFDGFDLRPASERRPMRVVVDRAHQAVTAAVTTGDRMPARDFVTADAAAATERLVKAVSDEEHALRDIF